MNSTNPSLRNARSFVAGRRVRQCEVCRRTRRFVHESLYDCMLNYALDPSKNARWAAQGRKNHAQQSGNVLQLSLSRALIHRISWAGENRLSRAMAKRTVVEAGGRATLGVSTAVRAPRLEGETTTRILPVAAIRSRLRSIFQSQASGQGLK